MEPTNVLGRIIIHTLEICQKTSISFHKKLINFFFGSVQPEIESRPQQ